MKTSVYNTKAEAVREIELDDSVFGAPVKPQLFWEVVKMQLANRRRGTHKTKRVSEVRGTGKKPYKQKGTGRARHGSMRAVGMRKGAVVHGPQPRDYSYELPKKMVRGALRSALSLRLREKALYVVGDWRPAAPKTKDAAGVLGGFKCRKALVVDIAENVNLAKSIRNLPQAKFVSADAVNLYDVLNHDHLLLGEAAISTLVRRLKTTASRRDQEQSRASTA